MFTVVITSMPASSSRCTSCHRLSCSEPGRVGVREFVDQGDLRVPGQDGVGVHFGQFHAAVVEDLAGDDGQVADLVGGEFPAVGLVQADDHVGAAVGAAASLAEHVDGFPDAGGRAQVHPQPAAVLHLSGGSTRVFGCGHRVHPAELSAPSAGAS